MKNYVELLKLEGLLPPGTDWITAKNLTSRCPRTLWNHSVSETIRTVTGIDIKAQFWMQDNSRLTFEFALGNREGIDIGSDEWKNIVKIRESIAGSFKDFVFSKNPPDCIELSKRVCSTVANVKINNNEDTANLATYFQFFSKTITEWGKARLPKLLEKSKELDVGIERQHIRQHIRLEAEEADATRPFE